MERKEIKAGTVCIETLEKAGYTAYFVGGYVRDLVLQREMGDIDVATSAHPEQVMALFPRVIPTGLSHGTVTVLIEETPVEVTTFRRESGYEDHRHPDAVYYVETIEEDLSRRDFTMNAMALDIRGQRKDPFGGFADLQSQIIKGVGDPVIRFSEDPLRMLRAIRFASQLDFTIEDCTYEAIKKCASLIRHIAMERIQVEWNKAILSNHPDQALRMLLDTGLSTSIPALNQLISKWKVERHTLSFFTALPTLSQRLAFLFLQGEVYENHGLILQEMKYDRKTKNRVQELIDVVQRLKKGSTPQEFYAAYMDYGKEPVLQGANMYDYFQEGNICSQGKEIYDQMIVRQLKDLAVKGDELQVSLRRQGGPWVRQLLFDLAMEVNLRLLPNDKKSLMEKARMVNHEIT